MRGVGKAHTPHLIIFAVGGSWLGDLIFMEGPIRKNY
jgi:hypothetical protein